MQTTKRTVITLAEGDALEIRTARADGSFVSMLVERRNAEADGSAALVVDTWDVTWVNGEELEVTPRDPQLADNKTMLVSEGSVTITIV